MRIRWIPAVVSVAVCAGLLFGGWFTYDKFAVKDPLAKTVNGLPEVASSTSTIENGTVKIALELTDHADLRTIYSRLTTEGASVLDGRKLKLEVQGVQSNAALDKLWSTVLFDVAQAMETKSYSDIPDALHKLAAANPGLTVETEMDETNVYVTLRDKGAVKYVILPRTPATLEVWNDAVQL
ncbi:conserved hypothetical protein [Paenibacillus curdlanolyticus YK9]|uniref:Uncharacterized protein n=1 Tax=Paenibacillus curdlanolyticus YK9 TaxID=717606 RepID=E0IC40_9BACL|nr:hypothetical protein [Paenibacillus curdlanolyticus]EFM09726.1 conserved hypothetical protein [Paenibacillus curdlanolyticus YK9]